MTVKENIPTIKKYFNKYFYDVVYDKWRVKNEKAAKDIVGEEYEKLREIIYRDIYNLEVCSGRKVFGSSYNCDTVVKKDGTVVILEEDKASYVDSCFLGRAMLNAVEIFDICLEEDLHIPYFMISSSTTMGNFQDIYEKRIRVFRKDLQNVMKEKFIYFPLCKHGRVNQKKYFKTEETCFKLSDELLKKQDEFIIKNVIEHEI